MRNIGILTSGGDAPGMNAVICSAVRYSVAHGFGVVGFLNGYNGLIGRATKPLDEACVEGIASLGGTVIKTDRCQEFFSDAGVKAGSLACKELGLEGLIVVGGDGSLRGAAKLAECGVNCIGIPATIDNDASSTEYTIGFDTAVNTATKMVDCLMDSIKSHSRCAVVEVMGRDSGRIALATALATNADYLLLPTSREEQERELVEKIKRRKAKGKDYFLIVVAEGYPNKGEVARVIQENTGCVAKNMVLGYLQRGGAPTATDRIVATKMGALAVELIAAQKSNRMLAVLGGKVVDLDLKEALKAEPLVGGEEDQKAEEMVNLWAD